MTSQEHKIKNTGNIVIAFQSLNWLETDCGLRFAYEAPCGPMVAVYRDGELIARYDTNGLTEAVKRHSEITA